MHTGQTNWSVTGSKTATSSQCYSTTVFIKSKWLSCHVLSWCALSLNTTSIESNYNAAQDNYIKHWETVWLSKNSSGDIAWLRRIEIFYLHLVLSYVASCGKGRQLSCQGACKSRKGKVLAYVREQNEKLADSLGSNQQPQWDYDKILNKDSVTHHLKHIWITYHSYTEWLIVCTCPKRV